MAALPFHEFFSGSGLVSVGLSPYFKAVWANDINEVKARVYRANLEGSVLSVGDIKDVDGSDGMSTAGKIVALFETLARVSPTGTTREKTARMCGCSLALVNALQSMGVSVDEGGEEAEDGWMEGLNHEDVD